MKKIRISEIKAFFRTRHPKVAGLLYYLFYGGLKRTIKEMSTIRGFNGVIVEAYVKATVKPCVFTDFTGNHLWLYPDDQIKNCYIQRSYADTASLIKFLQGYVQPGWFCIDIGANRGWITLNLWKMVGDSGRVIAIEADPSNIKLIHDNYVLNHLPMKEIMNYAITDKSGTIELHVYPGFNGWQSIGTPTHARNQPSYTINVPSTRFDELFKINETGIIHMVKMDIEGSELLALEGMKDFLKAKKIKCIVFEVNRGTQEGVGSSVEQLLDFWKQFDYELWQVGEDGSLKKFAGLLPDDYSYWDCVAIAR